MIELLADEVGDDGVESLVVALHGLLAKDAAPVAAESLLASVAQSPTSPPAARRAAERLLVLWTRHRDGLFPEVAAIVDAASLDWPDAS